MARKPVKPRSKKVARKRRPVGTGKKTERAGRSETQAAGGSSDAPRSLPPPRVQWRDDSHAGKARGPKRVQQRIERIAKRVWRSVPDREQKVINLAPHDILLMSGPVGEGSPDHPLDEISKLACWKETQGIFLNVEAESSDPKAEECFSFLIAHELAHVYLESASRLIHSGASLLADRVVFPPSSIPQLKAIAAAYGPESEQDKDAKELMVTALAISWGLGPKYLVTWLLDRQARGVAGKDPDSAAALALFTRHGR